MPDMDSPQPKPDPNEKLIKVFDTEDESEGIVVQGLLEAAEIESDLRSVELTQNAFPGLGGVEILVREEDEGEITAAAYLPARSAGRVDPVKVLRAP